MSKDFYKIDSLINVYIATKLPEETGRVRKLFTERFGCESITNESELEEYLLKNSDNGLIEINFRPTSNLKQKFKDAHKTGNYPEVKVKDVKFVANYVRMGEFSTMIFVPEIQSMLFGRSKGPVFNHYFDMKRSDDKTIYFSTIMHKNGLSHVNLNSMATGLLYKGTPELSAYHDDVLVKKINNSIKKVGDRSIFVTRHLNYEK